jgi:CRP/FNR family transcriptional regulator, anaerobic regulatory protein
MQLNVSSMKKVIDLFDSIQPLSDGCRSALYEKMKTEIIKKKTRLLRTGQLCNKVSFLEYGLCRCFSRKESKEHTTWFVKEGELLISVISFLLRTPSNENIESLEECLLYSLSYDELEDLCRHFPEFNYIYRKIQSQYYCRSHQRGIDLATKKAEERYEEMKKDRPDIIKRVSNTHLASYLGMSLETLIRIKKKKRGAD